MKQTVGNGTCVCRTHAHRHTTVLHTRTFHRSQQGCVVTDAAVRSGCVLVKLELLAQQAPAAAADTATWARAAYSAFAAAVQEWVRLLQLDAQLDARAPVLLQVDSVRGRMVWDVDAGLWSMADGLAPTSSVAEGEAVAHLMKISRISVACPAAMLPATEQMQREVSQQLPEVQDLWIGQDQHQQQQDGQGEGFSLSVRASVCVPAGVVLLGWTGQEQEQEMGARLGGHPLGKKGEYDSSRRSSGSSSSRSNSRGREQQRPGASEGMAVQVLAHLQGAGYMPTRMEVVRSVPAAVAEAALGEEEQADALLGAGAAGAVDVQVGEDSNSTVACGV